MTVRLYNSMSRRKEDLVPRVPGQLGIYVCGMTVYDYCHIGHARMIVAFDVIVRHLRACGFDVTYVRNITDIDDKIIARAAANNEPIGALTERFIAAMNEDFEALGVQRPDFEPRATDSIDSMQAIIGRLIEGGYAYQGSSGDVFYAVRQFADYGALSGKNPSDLRAGERVDVDNAKRDPLDFVLWKRAKPDEPSWPSPWGEGRPGWHIECSAMSSDRLGDEFDIHGGGTDLQFPHHENEIAQSCAASGKGFARYWLHNGFVQVDQEKMSKSLNNFFTIRDLLGVHRPEALRWFLISTHYRKPINYSDAELVQAQANLTRLYTALRGLPDGTVPTDEPYSARFDAAMNDDFNTPGAIAVLFDIARGINRAREDGADAQAASLAALLRQLAGRLGVLRDPAEAWLQQADANAPSAADIEAAISRRTAARASGDYAAADRERDALAEQGVILEDSGGETTWRRA